MTATAEKPKAKNIKPKRAVLHARLEPAKTKELGDGVLEAVITSGRLDHHGETINMDGVDVSDYHGPVLYGHDYEGLPIGKTLSLTKMKSKIKARFELFTEDYPFADLVYRLILKGGLTDVSIGGLVRKWNDDYTEIEEMVMKEFSVVPIGANPDAIITAKSLGKSVKDIKSEYHQFVQRSMLDNLENMPDDEIKNAVKVLENLVANLKDVANANSGKGETQIEVKRIKRFTLEDSAKAVATQSHRVIKLVKFRSNDE